MSSSNNNPRQILYSRKQAAAALSLSVRSVDHLIKRGALQHRRLGKRVLVHEDDLLRFANSTHHIGRLRK
jgi:excisionase family DNA binding protein